MSGSAEGVPEDLPPYVGRVPASDTALLETLILQAPVAFAFYDTELRYRRINRALADINGVPMGDHVGRRPSEVLPGELGRAVEARLQEVLDTRSVIADDDFVARSPRTGLICHYESRWFPATGLSGEVIGVAVLVSDVTERRRNQDALRQSLERIEKLQRATAALAEALTVSDVRRVVQHVAMTVAGAVRAELIVFETGRRRLPVDDTVERSMVRFDLVVSGDRIGALDLQLPLDEPVGSDDVVFLRALAGQCAIALERARLYERERATAVALQRSLLPDRLPDVAGIELAARFRPGSAEAEVGGDWYDAFTVPGGRVVLVVGDVMGKGVRAAAGMGRLRSALRALAHVDPSPAAVLDGLDRVFTATEGPDEIATLVYLLVDPDAGTATVGAAGHLPLVRIEVGQDPELVDAGTESTPLGWPEPRGERTIALGPGDILLGLTDGLVERRRSHLDAGLAAVLALVREPEPSLAALVERVGTELMQDTLGRDDATVLAVRLRH